MNTAGLLELQNIVVSRIFDAACQHTKVTDLSDSYSSRLLLLGKLLRNKRIDNISRLMRKTIMILHLEKYHAEIMDDFFKKFPPRTLNYYENAKQFYQYVMNQGSAFIRHKYLFDVLHFEMTVAHITWIAKEKNKDKEIIKVINLQHDIYPILYQENFSEDDIHNKHIRLLLAWDYQQSKVRIFFINNDYEIFNIIEALQKKGV